MSGPVRAPALDSRPKMVALCCTRLGDRQQARSAASQVRSAATDGNLARLIPSPNPAWIDEIEQAVQNALGNGHIGEPWRSRRTRFASDLHA